MKPDTLGQFEQLVLTAVTLLRDKGYTLTIHKKVEELSGKRVNLGSVYVTLDRLEDKGYLASWLADPTPERGGRRKRFYRLLEAGGRALQESASTARRIYEALDESWGLLKWRRNAN